MRDIKNGFIDIHTHVIPHVDDGAANSAVSMKMIDMAYKQGVRKIVATPHYEVDKYDENQEIIHEYFYKLKDMAVKNYPDFEMFLGNEVYYSYGVVDKILSGEINTMAGSRYVLMEFSPGDVYKYIREGVLDVINAGFMPIIAHVERYENVFNSRDNMEELRNVGAYMQVNSKSVAGQGGFFRGRKVLKYIREGYIDFIATDAHSTGRRAPEIEGCLNVLRKKFDNDTIRKLMIENPKRVIENKLI